MALSKDVTEIVDRWRGVTDYTIFFSYPITVCPDCYRKRGAYIPIYTIKYGGSAKFVLPDGTKVGDAHGFHGYCLQCEWTTETPT